MYEKKDGNKILLDVKLKLKITLCKKLLFLIVYYIIQNYVYYTECRNAALLSLMKF